MTDKLPKKIIEIQELAINWLNSSDEHGHNTNKNRVDAYCAGFDCRDKLDNEALKLAVEALDEIAIEQQFYIAKKDYFSEVVRLNLTAKETLAEIRKLTGEVK